MLRSALSGIARRIRETGGAILSIGGIGDGEYLQRDGSSIVGTAGTGGGDTLPIVDTTAVVKDPGDATKLVRIDAGAITTGTTRVINMPDADITPVDTNDARLSDARRWLAVATSKYTAAPASSSTITMSNTSDMYVGAPLRYSDSGGPWYAVVTAVTSNTSITIAGAPLDTGDDITALHVGTPEMVIKENINESTKLYGAATGDIGYGDQWDHGSAFIVSFSGWHEGEDATAQPKVNLEVGGAAVSTNDTNNGIQLGSAATASNLNRVTNSAVAVNTTNYAISRGDRLQGTCTVAGTAGDAEYLHLTVLAVLA